MAEKNVALSENAQDMMPYFKNKINSFIFRKKDDSNNQPQNSSLDGVVGEEEVKPSFQLDPQQTQIIQENERKLFAYNNFDDVKNIIGYKKLRNLATELDKRLGSLVNELNSTRLDEHGQISPTLYIGGDISHNHNFNFGEKLVSQVVLYATFDDELFYKHSTKNKDGSEPITDSFMNLAIKTNFVGHYKNGDRPEDILKLSEMVKDDCYGIAFKIPLFPDGRPVFQSSKVKKLSDNDLSVVYVISDKTCFDHYNSQK